MLLRNDICGYACGFKPPKYVVLSIRKLNWCAVCKYVAYCIESSLYTWVFNFFQMNEGRKSQIVLPDERRLDLLIQVSNHLLGEKIKTMNHRKSGPLTDTYCMDQMAGTVSKAKNTALICVSLCVILVELDHHFEVGVYLWLDMLYKL